jgi:ATP-dependent Lhr-like helicase
LLAPTVRLKADTTDDRDLPARETAILEALNSSGASFFGPLHEAVGGGYPGETVDALWNLVWRGLITNDTFPRAARVHRARVPRGGA